MNSKSFLIVRMCVLMCFGVAATISLPVMAHEGHDHHAMQDMATDQKVVRSTVNYTIPSVQLIREDGTTIDLPKELDDGRAVILNFVYTTCTETCPLTSETFSKFQSKLGKGLGKVHMASISIDPEQDTPVSLKKYAKKYKAKSQWNFYTGTVEASAEVQKSFQVYSGDKMNHLPVTFLRTDPSKPWLRIEGFTSADELLKAYQELRLEK